MKLLAVIKLKHVPKAIKLNNELLYDTKYRAKYRHEIPSEINKYFVLVGPNLAKNMPTMTNSINDFISPSV
jgi:hypothetical protein